MGFSMNAGFIMTNNPDQVTSRSVQLTFPPASFGFATITLGHYWEGDDQCAVTAEVSEVRLRDPVTQQDNIFHFNDPLPTVWGPGMSGLTFRFSTFLAGGGASWVFYRWD